MFIVINKSNCFHVLKSQTWNKPVKMKMQWLVRCWASSTTMNRQLHSSFHYCASLDVQLDAFEILNTFNMLLLGAPDFPNPFWVQQSGIPRVSHPWSPLKVSRRSFIDEVVSSTPLVFLQQWVASSFLVMLSSLGSGMPFCLSSLLFALFRRSRSSFDHWKMHWDSRPRKTPYNSPHKVPDI